MRCIELTVDRVGRLALPLHALSGVAEREEGGCRIYHNCSEHPFVVKQSLDEIIAKIEEANNQAETALHQQMPVGEFAWAEHPEAMLNRKIGALVEELDAWKKAANVAREHEAKLKADLDTARKALDYQFEQRRKLQDEVAGLISRTPGPLEPNRIIATAHALVSQAAESPQHFHQKSYLFRLVKVGIEALYGGDAPKLKAYETKGQL